MRNNGKKIKATVLALSVSAFALGAAACSPLGSAGYTIPADKEIQVNVAYTPDFKLKSGWDAEIIEFNAPINSLTKLDGDSFTPDVTGSYEYVVRFTKSSLFGGATSVTETIVFYADDTLAPTLGEFENKQAELGYYTDLKDDMATIAEKATDNCATTIVAYAESVTFNGVTSPVERGADALLFTATGEYVVNYVAEDYSGNKSRGGYTITVIDTVSPYIEAPEAFLTWLEQGKAKLPMANVIELEQKSLEVSAKDVSGVTSDVIDGYLVTNKTGEYLVTFKATDKSGNVSEKTVRTFVKNAGTLGSFSSVAESSVWSGSTSYYYNGKLTVLADTENASIAYSDYFVVNDWSAYKKLVFNMANVRANELTVQAEIYTDGEWKKCAPYVFDAATIDSDFVGVNPLTGVYEVYLEDLGITSADGVRLNFACEGGINATVSSVNLVATDDREFIESTGDFKGKFSLKSGAVAVLKGSALKDDTAKLVKLNLSSTAETSVRVVLNFGSTVVSSIRSLKQGENVLTFAPETEKGVSGLLASGLTSVQIYNEADYAVTLYSNGVALATTLAVEDYAITGKTYGISYGESMAVPYPFLVSDKYYSDFTVKLLGNGVNKTVAVGEKLSTIGDSALGHGSYQIVYSFKDAFGGSQTLVYDFSVEKKILWMEVNMSALFLGEEGSSVQMPKPSLTSDVYSNTQLKEVEIKTYYRELGRSRWTEATAAAPFAPTKSRWFEIRYVATYGDARKELVFEKYVHQSPMIIDFEPESDVGMDAQMGVDKKFKSRFLYDGGYYDYRETYTYRPEPSTDWSVSGSTSLSYMGTSNGWFGFLIRPYLRAPEGTKVNAIRFWLKADAGMSNATIEIGNGISGEIYNNGWIISETFDVKAGVHQYTLMLDKTVDASKISSFIYPARANNRWMFDDIEFLYLEGMQFGDLNYEASYDMAKPYKAEKPVLTSDMHTQTEIANAVYELKLVNAKGEESIVMPDQNGEYYVNFKKAGKYEFVWKATIGTRSVEKRVSALIASFDFEAEVPASAYTGEMVTLPAPTSSEYTLENVNVEISFDGENWTNAEKTNSGYTFTPTIGGGYYTIRYTATAQHSSGGTLYGEIYEKIWVRTAGDVVFDFEPIVGGADNGFDNLGAGNGYDGVENAIASQLLSTDQAHTGEYSMFMHAWKGMRRGFNLQENVTKAKYGFIEFWLYSESGSSLPLFVTVMTDVGDMDTPEFKLAKGWNKYQFVLDKSRLKSEEISLIKSITFSVGRDATGGTKCYVDDITLKPLSLNKAMPTNLLAGDLATLPECSLGKDAKSAEYRLKGASAWTKVGENNSATFVSAGIYEIRYVFEGQEVVYEITVNAPTTADLDEKVKKTVKLDEIYTLPTASGFAIKMIEYKAVTGDWVVIEKTAEGYKVAFDALGEYTLRYTFGDEAGSYQFEKVYSLEVVVPQITVNGAFPAELSAGTIFNVPTASYIYAGGSENLLGITYRKKGQTEWLDVAESKILLKSVGVYEIRYEFERFELVKEITALLPSNVTFSAEYPVEHKASTAFTIPTATADGEIAKIFFKEALTSEWVEVTMGSVTPTKNGDAEVKYVFANFEVIKALKVVDPNTIVTFEGSNPFYGGKLLNGDKYERLVTDQFGGTALEITPLANGWFGFTNAQVNAGAVKKLRILYTCNASLTVNAGYYKGKASGEFDGWSYTVSPVQFAVGTGELIMEFASDVGILKSLQFELKGSATTRILIHEIYVVTE